MNFSPNRKFRRDYDKIFKKDPCAANLLLLLAELADENGNVVLPANLPEIELQKLMSARFDDPKKYHLKREH